ncbi:hypothetical protein [Psychrosphaera algicola]|uniref:Phytase-like domain-containing protein n=1 Tax=Psychrosphaera algicola TaxID=3023714 RepID=A0ABT5FB00_9GAMM|nr:hypothetical protein [Psychrosphaera sp. G1-22]MDC2888219.1 hypothetical protein [Psychrosphaera sp. G1-22]
MLWQGDGQKLLLLPELSSRPAISLNKFGEQQDIEMSQHGFRISDATHIYDQCAIITSFCYKNDPICEKQNKRSKLVLASIQLDSEQIVFNKTVNISEQHLQTNISKNSYPALFNAEGIVMDNGYVYLVNDDNPKWCFYAIKTTFIAKGSKKYLSIPNYAVNLTTFPLKPAN